MECIGFCLDTAKQVVVLLHQWNSSKSQKQLLLLLEKLDNDARLLKAFLEDWSNKLRKDRTLRELVRQIKNVIYEAEDVRGSIVTLSAEDKSRTFFGWNRKRADIIEQVESICTKIKAIHGRVDFACRTIEDSTPEKSEAPILRKDNVIGFEDEARKFIGYLKEETEQLDVICIIGPPGQGKTTLAWKIFRDPVIQIEFPKYIWIYVSEDFTKRDIFLALLKTFTNLVVDIDCKSDEELAQLVSHHLENEKFFLVMDNVWTPEDWEKLQIALPRNNKRGKVLITSRQVEVGWYANRDRNPHTLRFLSPEESWLLLRMEVFKKPRFPPELEVEGKAIASQCGGLPLAVVVIGSILVKKFSASGDVSAMKKSWKRVSESFYTYLNDDSERRMEKVISRSYEKLAYDLRECLLYMGMFPQDFSIPVDELIWQWIAGGMIKRKDNMSLEETGESYLEDLRNSSLVRAHKWKVDGKVKTCRIHGTIRDFCITEAGIDRENSFQEIKKSSDGGFQPPVSEAHKYRRLCIDQSNLRDFLSEKPCCPSVRSFSCFSEGAIPVQQEYISAIPTGFKQLQVLDIRPIKLTQLPSDMYLLHNINYMSLSLDSALLPEAFSKFRNIQTLIVDTTSPTLDIRVDIMNMTELMVFKTNASATLHSKTGNKGGEKIQRLGAISPESCTKEVLGRARNLKELIVRGKLALILEDTRGSVSFDIFRTLVNLDKLELVNDCSTFGRQVRNQLPPAVKFPPKLRHLTLCHTSLDWSHMSVLGLLENLEVLELKNKAFWGETWEVRDGGFRRLRVLHIGRTNLVNWVASRGHFPSLVCLELINCENLKQVPVGLADVPNFQLLVDRSRDARGIKRRMPSPSP